jgi:hypothetical protein
MTYTVEQGIKDNWNTILLYCKTLKFRYKNECAEILFSEVLEAMWKNNSQDKGDAVDFKKLLIIICIVLN